MAGWKAIAFTGCVFVSSSSCVPTTATRPLRLSAGQDRIADLGEGMSERSLSAGDKVMPRIPG